MTIDDVDSTDVALWDRHNTVFEGKCWQKNTLLDYMSKVSGVLRFS